MDGQKDREEKKNGVIRKAEIIRNWKEMGREGGRKRRKKGEKEASKYVKVREGWNEIGDIK